MFYWDSKSLDLFEDEVFGKASVGAQSAVPSSLYSLNKLSLHQAWEAGSVCGDVGEKESKGRVPLLLSEDMRMTVPLLTHRLSPLSGLSETIASACTRTLGPPPPPFIRFGDTIIFRL